MITQKITHNKDTGKIIQFQEYKDNVLCIEELYNEDNMVIQRNYPMDNSMVKLFFDNEYWYVLNKTSHIVYKENNSLYRITKYSRKDNPNPIEENLIISLGSRIRIKEDSEECTQLCTPIDNNKAVDIIKELFKQKILNKHDLSEATLTKNKTKIIYTNWEINER